MKECYLVMQSKGEYEDYRAWNTGTVFLSLFSAEKVKKDIEEYYASETPFPFDWCNAETFRDLNCNSVLEEDLDKYDKWIDEYYKKEEFNKCWIQTLTLEE